MYYTCCPLGGNSPWVSHVSTCFVSRNIDSFCSRLTLQRCLYSEQSWKIEIVSPFGDKADLFFVWDKKDNVFF